MPLPLHRPTGARERGFTLIEMLVVVFLLGTAFTYALLNIDTLVPGTRLDAGARDIGRMMTRLRGMAIFKGVPIYLEYDLDGHRYRVVRPSTELERDDGAEEFIETRWEELPRRVRFQDVQFSELDRETRGIVQVEFTPTGEVVGHMVHLISDDIENPDLNRFTLELNPVTGLVSYTRGEKLYAQVKDEFEFR